MNDQRPTQVLEALDRMREDTPPDYTSDDKPDALDEPVIDDSVFDQAGKPPATGTLLGRYAVLSAQVHPPTYPADLLAIDGDVGERARSLDSYGTWTLRRALARTLTVCHDETLADDLRATLLAEAADMLVVLRRRAARALDYDPQGNLPVTDMSGLSADPDAVRDDVLDRTEQDDESTGDAFADAIGST